jgi:NAD(P)-dependent dehydrogenase (short-subunit alcohol dehydrogenase family)
MSATLADSTSQVVTFLKSITGTSVVAGHHNDRKIVEDPFKWTAAIRETTGREGGLWSSDFSFDYRIEGREQMIREAAAQWKRGAIVNIASMLALFPNPLAAAYVAAKHGLGGLTQSVSSEAAAHGISLTLVCPGYITTNLFRAGTFEGALRSDDVIERIPFRFMDVDTAVARTLEAVLARRSQAILRGMGFVQAP